MMTERDHYLALALGLLSRAANGPGTSVAPVELGLCCQFRPPRAPFGRSGGVGLSYRSTWLAALLRSALGTSVGRVRLYTINGANWSKRHPLIVEAAAHIQGSAIMDAEVVWQRQLPRYRWNVLDTFFHLRGSGTISVQDCKPQRSDC